MANSGIYWIDETFNFCVRLLYDIGAFLGISYEEINVWLFCVIWPIASLLLFAEVIIKFNHSELFSPNQEPRI